MRKQARAEADAKAKAEGQAKAEPASAPPSADPRSTLRAVIQGCRSMLEGMGHAPEAVSRQLEIQFGPQAREVGIADELVARTPQQQAPEADDGEWSPDRETPTPQQQQQQQGGG